MIDSGAPLKSKHPVFGKYPRGLIRARQQIASYESGGPQHVFAEAVGAHL